MDRRFRTRGTEDRSRREFLVCGMGGAGKTQIALKFVETRAKSYALFPPS
jgi:tetraacyldisaccharide-1-P 4'-kinase